MHPVVSAGMAVGGMAMRGAMALPGGMMRAAKATPGGIMRFASASATALKGGHSEPMSWGAKAAVGSAVAISGGIGIGGAAGKYGGLAWDRKSRESRGQAIGFKVGATMAGAGLFASGGLGRAAKGGLNLMQKEHQAGRLIGSAIAGGAVGGLMGPSDSTLANVAMGASAGIMGAGLLARTASWNKITKKKGLKTGTAFGIRSSVMMHKGRLMGRIGGFKTGVHMSRISAGGSSLFATTAAHGMIGSSRRNKKQNSLNKY